MSIRPKFISCLSTIRMNTSTSHYGNRLLHIPCNVYEGNFKCGLKHGYGKQTFDLGGLYEGEWWEDKMHGKGKYTFTDGSVYCGDWINNTMHGQGSLQCSTDGSEYKYVGAGVNGMKYGHGKLIEMGNGTTVEAEWIEGVIQSNMQNILDHEGDYDLPDDIPSSNCKRIQHDIADAVHLTETVGSNSYDCEWLDGQMHTGATSTITQSTGEVPASSDSSSCAFVSQGSYRFANGDVYTGEWAEGVMHGQGTMRFADDGGEYVGWWKEGQPHGLGKYKYTSTSSPERNTEKHK